MQHNEQKAFFTNRAAQQYGATDRAVQHKCKTTIQSQVLAKIKAVVDVTVKEVGTLSTTSSNGYSPAFITGTMLLLYTSILVCMGDSSLDMATIHGLIHMSAFICSFQLSLFSWQLGRILRLDLLLTLEFLNGSISEPKKMSDRIELIERNGMQSEKVARKLRLLRSAMPGTLNNQMSKMNNVKSAEQSRSTVSIIVAYATSVFGKWTTIALGLIIASDIRPLSHSYCSSSMLLSSASSQ